MDRGILYIVGDDDLYDEAITSAKRVRQHTSADIAVITDRDQNGSSGVFDQVIHKSGFSYGFRDKVKFMRMSPFDKTIYLDTDTYVTSDLKPLFDLLDHVDIVASYAPHRENGDPSSTVPSCFPMLNTGVIAFANRELVSELFNLWERYYTEIGLDEDQSSFSKAIYKSSVRYHVLPSEWNCRSNFPGYLGENVKIIHGRHDDLASVERKLNFEDGKRVHYCGREGDIKLRVNGANWVPIRIYRSIKNQGIEHTIQKINQYLTGRWKDFAGD